MKLILLALFTLVLVASCEKRWGSDFAELRAENSQVSAEWYLGAWGRAQTEEEAARVSSQFECAWDALTEAGKDPVVEMQCLIRRMRAGKECFHTLPPGQPLDRCREVFESACPPSADFQRVVATCVNRPPAR